MYSDAPRFIPRLEVIMKQSKAYIGHRTWFPVTMRPNSSSTFSLRENYSLVLRHGYGSLSLWKTFASTRLCWVDSPV